MRVNFSWTLVGNIVYAACQLGMLSVLAKFGSIEMVGQFALALAVTTPIIVFANLNLLSVQATDIRGEFDFGVYLALRLLMLAAAGSVVAVVCLFGRYASDTTMVIMGVALAKAVESVGEVFHGLFQRHERMDYIAFSRMAKGLLSLAVFAAVVYLTRSLLWAVLSLAVTWAVPLVWCDIRNAVRILAAGAHAPCESGSAGRLARRLLVPRWNLPRVGQLAILALPLAIATLLVSLAVNVPRYFIAYHCGEIELGYFVSLLYATVALDMIVRPLATSAMPRLAQYFQSNRTAYVRCLAKILGVVAAVNLVMVATAVGFGKEILSVLYADDYADYAPLFVAITVSAAISSAATALSLATTAARLYQSQLLVYSLNLVFVCAACVILIPGKGLWGGAIVLGASSVFRVVILLSILRWSLRKPCAAAAIPCGKVQPCRM